jgi:tetratricopeptide (TPR) repeat protein
LGDLPAAAADIRDLRESDPSDLEGLYLQSWLHVSNNEHELAQQLLLETSQSLREISAEHREKLPQAELLFGIVDFLAADYKQVVEHFTTFLVRFPKHSGATRYLVAIYLATGDWGKVIRTLNSAQGEEMTEHPAILSLLAKAFRSSGNLNRAIRIYERALEIAPGQPELILGLATARFAVGNSELGVASLEQLLSTEPDFFEAQLELVGMYVAIGRVLDSLALARQLAKANPDNAAMQNLLGATLMEAGRYRDAKIYFMMAENIDPLTSLRNCIRHVWRAEWTNR